MANNPLAGYYRSPKLYTQIPSRGLYYDKSVVDMEPGAELPVYSMTAKDEMIMKNPDALLNGEAVAQVIRSCVPAVKKPREMISNDVDALLIAIQSATAGDEIDVEAKCPGCEELVRSVVSIEDVLSSMSTLSESSKFTLDNGLTVEVRPFTYESTIKAGVTNFKSSRSLQAIANIDDELEQLKAFNENFLQIAALNFDLVVDSVATISGTDPDGEPFIVSDRKNIREFLENCDSDVGHKVEEEIKGLAALGVNKKIMLECEACGDQFEQEIGFDPVNFSSAS